MTTNNERELLERVLALETKVKKLELDLELISGQHNIPRPSFPNPYIPEPDKIPQWPNNPIEWPYRAGSQCPECGIKLEGVVGYVCNRPNCPTGLGPIMCDEINPHASY